MLSANVQGHEALNILSDEIDPSRNWKCENGTEKAVVILQLEKASVLSSIHVGNAHSAFVEVLVGRASDAFDRYQSLVPMSSFMNPHESKTGSNPNRTRFFGKRDFVEATADKSWDRLKVVCSQPFNRHVPYGLCFVRIQGERNRTKAEMAIESRKMEDEIGNFFQKKRDSKERRQLPGVRVKKEDEVFLDKRTSATVAALTVEKNRKCSVQKKSRKMFDESRSEKVTAESKKTDKRGRKKKAFESLMEDVVLVISGFQNPLRSCIRSKALAMGAEYSVDWGPACTHLVCAYKNTPKFKQVKGKGIIVKKEWIEKCYSEKKRYPWKKFALDSDDGKLPESEEEIEAAELTGSDEENQVGDKNSQFVFQTESKEMELVSNVVGSISSKLKDSFDDLEYDIVTDEERAESPVTNTADFPMPYLPNVFSSKSFYLDPLIKSKSVLERYILAYDGILMETLTEEVDFHVMEVSREAFLQSSRRFLAVKPSWIVEVKSKQLLVSPEKYLV